MLAADAEMLAAIEAELAKRDALRGERFEAQRRASEDPSRKKLYSTNRRAGKSHNLAMDIIDDMLEHPNSNSWYVGKTVLSAKSAVIPMFHEIDARHGLGLRIIESRNLVRFPNGSQVQIHGSDKAEAMHSARGVKNFRRIVVDEAGFLHIDLERFYNSVFRPALSDCRGTVCLATTPAESKHSWAYKIYNGDVPGWSVHQWSADDNPYTRDAVAEERAEILAENPEAAEAPWFKREWLGEWVFDDSAHVYQFDEDSLIDRYEPDEGDQYILGVDLGYHPDATAFSVIAWNPYSPRCVELECFKETEMLIGTVAHRIREYLERYPGIQCVGDSANKYVFEELRQRYRVPLMPSYKAKDKRHVIELLNTDIKSGNTLFVRGTTEPHQEEMAELTWVPRPSGGVIEDRGKHNDCCDAFLMAWRLSRHFRHKDREKPVKPGTTEHLRKQAEERRKRYIAQLRKADALEGF